MLQKLQVIGEKMGSLFEIHRSNLEWLKSYVYPDGFKLDPDRYQIGVSFELCHEPMPMQWRS